MCHFGNGRDASACGNVTISDVGACTGSSYGTTQAPPTHAPRIIARIVAPARLSSMESEARSTLSERLVVLDALGASNAQEAVSIESVGPAVAVAEAVRWARSAQRSSGGGGGVVLGKKPWYQARNDGGRRSSPSTQGHPPWLFLEPVLVNSSAQASIRSGGNAEQCAAVLRSMGNQDPAFLHALAKHAVGMLMHVHVGTCTQAFSSGVSLRGTCPAHIHCVLLIFICPPPAHIHTSPYIPYTLISLWLTKD
jgi:hypothetical protein